MTESCSASSCPADWEGEETGCEMEAAEVLASLAKSAAAVVEGGGGGVSVEGWASKGKRCGINNKRAKESLIVDSTLDSAIVKAVVVPMNFDLNEDQSEACEQESEKVGSNENDGAEELMARVEGHSSDSFPAGGKPRHASTEAEKEARRLRRVLANRESARQTIRRRQTLYEELTKKAASLALENESLKRERETAVKEYQSLQLVNKNLTEQMEKTLGPPPMVESRRHQGMAMLGNAGLPFVPSQNSSPFCLCNNETTLMATYVWPSGIQFSNWTPAQLGQHGIIAVSPTLVTPGSSGINSHEGSSSSSPSHVSQNAPPLPSSMMSVPLVVPVLHDVKSSSPHPISSFLLKDNQETQNFLDHEISSAASANTSSKSAPSLETHLCFPTMDVRREAIALAESHSQQPGAYNFSAVPIGLSFNEQCLPSVSQPNSGLVYEPATQVCCDLNTRSAAIKDVSIHQASGLVSEVVVPASSGGGQIPTVVQERKGVGVIRHNPAGKKMVDSDAAAEARKRRKELTDMKNLHCRPLRKPCFG